MDTTIHEQEITVEAGEAAVHVVKYYDGTLVLGVTSSQDPWSDSAYIEVSPEQVRAIVAALTQVVPPLKTFRFHEHLADLPDVIIQATDIEDAEAKAEEQGLNLGYCPQCSDKFWRCWGAEEDK